MNLIKEVWTENDIKSFETYLISIKNEEKINWTKNIINTKKKVLAIKSNILKNIAKEIYKGNFQSFLDYMLHNYHEEIIINAFIINKIKDYKLKTKYLSKYLKYIDNWASCDTLKFDNNNKYLELSEKYIEKSNNFTKRVGIIILFTFIKTNINEIFEILKKINSNDYYVNMAYAWILCECFIKKPKETINFLENNQINTFVINKMVSKINDSYRVTKEEKEKMKKYKKIIFLMVISLII